MRRSMTPDMSTSFSSAFFVDREVLVLGEFDMAVSMSQEMTGNTLKPEYHHETQ